MSDFVTDDDSDGSIIHGPNNRVKKKVKSALISKDYGSFNLLGATLAVEGILQDPGRES